MPDQNAKSNGEAAPKENESLSSCTEPISPAKTSKASAGSDTGTCDPVKTDKNA